MDQIEGLLSHLDQLLCHEIDVYQQLLALESAAKYILTGPVLEPVLCHLQAKERLSKRARELDRERQQVLAQLAPTLQLSEVTLKHLSTRVREPYAERFVRHRRALRQLVRDLQQCHRINAAFLRDSLALVNYALGFFQDVLSTHITYGQFGICASQPQGRFLSERI